jgi:hypothetical protein
MSTSSTFNFNMDVEEIIKEALDMVGGDLSSAEDLKKAKTALNLLLIDMQNRGHPLAQLKNTSFITTSAVNQYTLSAGTIDILDMVVVRNGTATAVKRKGLFEYHKIPNKELKGLPTQFTVDRDRETIDLYLYQTPENSTDTIDYWYLKKIEDAGSYTNNIDVNVRYLPAIIFGLAYFMALKRPGIDIEKRNELKENYLDTLGISQLEDRERVSYRVTPYPYNRGR